LTIHSFFFCLSCCIQSKAGKFYPTNCYSGGNVLWYHSYMKMQTAVVYQ